MRSKPVSSAPPWPLPQLLPQVSALMTSFDDGLLTLVLFKTRPQQMDSQPHLSQGTPLLESSSSKGHLVYFMDVHLGLGKEAVLYMSVKRTVTLGPLAVLT